jgi:hypothetical protein
MFICPLLLLLVLACKRSCGCCHYITDETATNTAIIMDDVTTMAVENDTAAADVDDDMIGEIFGIVPPVLVELTGGESSSLVEAMTGGALSSIVVVEAGTGEALSIVVGAVTGAKTVSGGTASSVVLGAMTGGALSSIVVGAVAGIMASSFIVEAVGGVASSSVVGAVAGTASSSVVESVGGMAASSSIVGVVAVVGAGGGPVVLVPPVVVVPAQAFLPSR